MKHISVMVIVLTFLFNTNTNAFALISANVIIQQVDESSSPDPLAPPDGAESEDKVFSYGLLMSGVMQGHNAFAGNSGDSHLLGNGALSVSVRPFSSTEINVTPMWMYGGMAGNGFGMAGNADALFSFSNATPFLCMAYVKQHISFGASDEGEESAQAVVTAGKIMMPAVFEASSYASDPTQQFLNISVLGFGAWETAQEARGSTYGASLQFSKSAWSFTVAAGMMPSDAGGLEFDTEVKSAHSIVTQFCVDVADGLRLRCLGFMNHSNAINFKQASSLLQSQAGNEEIDLSEARSYTVKYGFGIEAEDKISENVGAFVRASWNDGNTESFVFTQINSSISGGLDFSNGFFGTESGHAGFAFAYNMISDDHRAYLAAGGSGFMLGYGSLNYGSEIVGEAYYRLNLIENISMTLDYQFIGNAGYNKAQSLHLFSTRFTLGL